MKELRLTTTADDAGQRLDRVLSQAAPELSRAALQKAVQAGHCQIDGLPETRANTKVRPGQTIVLSLPETSTTLQAEEGHLELLWQDEHMVVWGGRTVTFDGGFADHNLNDLTFFTERGAKGLVDAIDRLCERGTGEDAGLYRATFYHGTKRARVVVDRQGRFVGAVEQRLR